MIQILYLLYDKLLDIKYYLDKDKNLSVKPFSNEYRSIDMNEVKKYYNENKTKIDIIICCSSKATDGFIWVTKLIDEGKRVILIDKHTGIYVNVIEPNLDNSWQNLTEITDLIHIICQN
ncbi:MAG: hypothetical protein HY973_02430 [Candidatus Kerfeldbacteria bacterium]|nr:hypothetical protein [Candidatus Kerfeldbacteria bacterium]